MFPRRKRPPEDAREPDTDDRSLGTCSYCPKLCSHTCTVSNATRRETHTPWGKQTTYWEMVRGMVPTSREYVEPLFACTECLACREVCDHGIDVPASLRRGRARVFEAGLLPGPLRRLVGRMGERERQARESIGALDGFASPGPGTRSVLLPGCQASLTDPDLVRDALTVLGALLPEPPAPFMDACCGLPYLHAGDVTGFERSARRLIASTSRFDTLVVLDPGCAYTIERLYPRYGLETRVEVLTLVEAVLPHLDRFVRRTNPRGPVFYHDPCHLGRGLGIYDAPREILLRLVAGGARDLHTSREREPCCGGGGAIPLSMGRVAQDAADRLAATMIAQGARTVVTACPTCTRMLSGRDDLACSDIVSLMAGAL